MSFGTSAEDGSKALFRLVADRLPLPVWIAGCDKRCTYFNKAWLDFTGRPLESEIGSGWADGVHTADRQQCLEAYTRAFDRREPLMMEYRLRRHDGEYRWVLDRAAPIVDGDGLFAGYIGACFDVNQFRSTEAERNVAAERLHLAMESGKFVGWEWDLETNRNTLFGDLPTIFGIPANIHVADQDDFRSLVHPDDRVLVATAVEDARESRSTYGAEFRIVWANGTLRWLAAKGQFYYAADGRAERMLGMAVDISERREVEQALQRKDAELKEAQRLAGVGSWHWDLATDMVVWSEELYRLAHRDPSLPAVSYRDHAHLYAPESWDRLQRAVETTLRTGAPYELRLEMVPADGTRRWLMARGEAQRDASGDIAGLRGTVQDVTDRKRAEEALSSVHGRLIEAQEAERARIARELHDDIGQRLTLLVMGLEQAKQLVSDASAHEVLSCLNGLLKRTAEIGADVQALSHELHPPRLVHLGVLAAMRGFCDELSRQKSVDVDFRHENVPAVVSPDVSLCLFRVLQEALHNAVRHSAVRRFDVHFRGTGDGLELTVRDDGVGFDVQAANRGRGLGLTSMTERVKAVSGELIIESRAEGGTTVLARVPVRRS